jgi:ferredoxin-NADP reductase
LRVGGENSWTSQLCQLARKSDSFNTINSESLSSLLFEQNLAFKLIGPYGHEADYSQYESVLFVAGGIGITGVMSSYKARGKSDKFVWIFKRGNFQNYATFFEEIPVEERDSFLFFETSDALLVDEEEDEEEWPYSAVQRGRPSLVAVLDFLGGKRKNVCVSCCGPETLSNELCYLASQRGLDFQGHSFML